ncbi:MAG: aspartate--tRNA ligase [Gemmatimonadota bacterium]|nr:aspartate--tRNA ligase [Gemmatimonadota bacterium]
MSDSEIGVPGPTAWRDIACGRLRASDAGRRVRLAGWVHRRRDLGGLVFLHLRDRTGRVQLSIGPDWTPPEDLARVADLSPEDVLSVEGEVALRPADAVLADLATGEVEVRVTRLERLAAADPLPILVAVPPEEALPSEELRLRHRVLDLRRPEIQRNFEVRHRATAAARAALSAEGFLEIETPFLTRRTPEGARDYLVPSRVHPGEFYALPQSPQLYKQLLMVAGFDRYFQVARCLRDEDLRADRQPEFTQIDVEMAFAGEEDIFGVCERMLARMYAEALDEELPIPFPRMPWAEALEAYGTDKPDLRIPWRIEDFSDDLRGLGFGIVDGVLAAGGRVRGFTARGGAELSRTRLAGLEERARAHGAKGVLWLKRQPDGWSGPPARFLEGTPGDALASRHDVQPGDLVLLVAGPDAETSRPLDALRRAAAVELGAVSARAAWTWVTDFPLFEADPETGAPVASHHPFTMPAEANPETILADPLSVGSRAYDLVLDGTELASGSIRCHDPAVQRAILGVLGMDAEEIESRFGFLLEAFRFGVPPHGGFAMGLDRLVAMMVGVTSIRDVIAFPKTTAARGLLEGAPSPIGADELAELGLRFRDGGGP